MLAELNCVVVRPETVSALPEIERPVPVMSLRRSLPTARLVVDNAVVVAFVPVAFPKTNGPVRVVEADERPLLNVTRVFVALLVNGYAKVEHVAHVRVSAAPPSETAPPPPSGADVFTVTDEFCRAVFGKLSDDDAAVWNMPALSV